MRVGFRRNVGGGRRGSVLSALAPGHPRDPCGNGTCFEQFAQLSTFIQTFSAGRPVIVGGDTNLKGARRPRDDQALLDLMGAANLQDAARTLGAPEDIDRFFFRSTAVVVLVPLLWREADEFVGSAGNDLSDHEAVNVDFEWRRMR